jgi:hypothetical protein
MKNSNKTERRYGRSTIKYGWINRLPKLKEDKYKLRKSRSK